MQSCVSTINIDNRLNLMLGNNKAIYLDSRTIRLKSRYFLNSTSDSKVLSEKNLISIDSNGESHIDINSNKFTFYSIKEITTKKVVQKAEPISLLVVVDKASKISNNLINEEVYYLIQTVINFFYSTRTDYEINYAAIAGEHNLFHNILIATPFFSLINDINNDTKKFIFNPYTNGGAPNLFVGLDSALNYINKNSKFKKRGILLITDHYSKISELNQTQNLIDKALALNTSINILSTTFPLFLYTNSTHQRLVNRTGGVNLINMSSHKSTSVDLIIPGLHSFLTGENYYESEFEIQADSDVFIKNPEVIIQFPIKCFDHTNLQSIFFYEK